MQRKELRKDPAVTKKRQFNPQIAEQLQLTLTIPAEVAPGRHELRLMTTNGISNVLLFDVGQMDEVVEQEPNDTVQKPFHVDSLPAVFNGQIMPGDVDCFRFSARRGQTLVFRAHARSLVPYLADAVPGWFQAILTLYDAAGREVAADDDFYFDPDPVLIYSVPADGDYTLAIRDSIYRGREDFVYRIEAGELPFIDHIFPLGGPRGDAVSVQLFGVNLPVDVLTMKTGVEPEVETVQVEQGGLLSNIRLFGVDSLPEMLETETGDADAPAQLVRDPILINGRIDAPGDVDRFVFEGRAGEPVSLEVVARRLGSPLDSRLVLLDAAGQIIAVSDDVRDERQGLMTHHADACIQTNLPASGLYTLRLDDLLGKGGDAYAYRLRIGHEKPGFSLCVTPASLRIPQDGSAVFTAHVVREGGFAGPVQLELNDAPRGISLGQAVIPEGTNQAQVTISATGRSLRETVALQIDGRAEVGSRTVVRRAVPAEDQMQAFLYRHLVPAQELVALIVEEEPVTITLDLPKSGVLEARPGETLQLKAAVSYQSDRSGALQLALSDPPEWISLKSKNISLRPLQTVQLVVSANAEVGDTATLLFTGKISINKVPTDPTYNPLLKWMNREERTVTIAAIPVKIVD